MNTIVCSKGETSSSSTSTSFVLSMSIRFWLIGEHAWHIMQTESSPFAIDPCPHFEPGANSPIGKTGINSILPKR